MPCTLNAEAYKRLLNEDIDWLRQQPSCLEREHILSVLEWARDYRHQFESGEGALPMPLPSPDEFASQRLRDFESVGEALWPFVRYFALAGGHPASIAAVVALGKLLGHTDASQSTVIEITEKVRAEAAVEIADKVGELLRGKVLSRDIEGIVEQIRGL